MIRCQKCLTNKKLGIPYTDCPCQGNIRTTGRDSANSRLHGHAGTGICLISEEYAGKDRTHAITIRNGQQIP